MLILLGGLLLKVISCFGLSLTRRPTAQLVLKLCSSSFKIEIATLEPFHARFPTFRLLVAQLEELFHKLVLRGLDRAELRRLG